MAEKTTPIELTSDYWPEEDKREKAGAVINVPFETALKLIEEGKAKRADPLRG